MNIEPLVKDQFYKVCLPYNDFEGNHNLCMKVKLEKVKEGYLIDDIEEYTMEGETTGQIEQKNIGTSWKGKYVYLAYDRDNFKNEYKIYIYSYDNVTVLNILDKDTIKYFSKVSTSHSPNESEQIALPLFTKEHRKDIDTLFLKKENFDDYYISGSPIYEINPGNNLWNPIIKKDDLSD